MPVPEVNFIFAWWWMAGGALTGAAIGLVFHREDAFGGYASWTRRLMRLGHIAFFGTGLLNLGFALSVRAVPDASPELLEAASIALLVGAITMPLTCYLAAWRKPWRHGFVIPVVSLTAGIVLTALVLTRSLL